MSIAEIKRYFTKNSNSNFLNDFTLQDVEDAKKYIYTNNYKRDGENLKYILDKAAEKLAKDKFYAGVKEDQGVAVKNTVRDVLNANYKNTITRLILIDSQYRPRLHEEETNFLIQLNEKVVNAVSLEMLNIQIPYTFYNIEERQGNNHIVFTETTYDASNQPVYGRNHWLILDDGHYKDMSVFLPIIKEKIQFINPLLDITIDTLTKTCVITNTSNKNYTVSFLTNKSKINHCLGWHLGFRKFQGSNLANKYMAMDYVLLAGNITPTTIKGTAVAMVPHIKYFVLVIEDFNHNQTADTMIQSNIHPENSKATSYFTQDPLLDQLTPDNLSSYVANVPNRSLTKSQLFTISQQNQEKLNLCMQNTRLEVHAPNQVLGMIPFEESKATWGSYIFTDKNKYTREYHSPTNIDRLQLKLYDDKGYLLNLNGSNWCMTLLTNNLYKY